MRFTEAITRVIQENPAFGTRLQQAQRLAKKWQKLGLMDNLEASKNTLMRTNVAIMLQNQAKQIIRQASYTSNSQFQEQWVGVAMPLVRRFMHKLAAKDFVTIQAMSQPAGLVFFLDHQFGSTRKGGLFTKGESIYGSTFTGNSGQFSYVMNTDLTAGLYGAGKFGYSLNEITTVSAVVATSGSTEISLGRYNNDTQFSESYAAKIADGRIKNLAITGLNQPDYNGIQAFYVYTNVTSTTASNYIVNVFQQYTRLNGTTVEFLVETGGSGSWTGNVTCSYHRQPLTYDRGDFEYRGADSYNADANGNIQIPEVQFKLSQKPIVPETRKMKATWTQQLIDDLNAFLAIDGEQEISNQLTDQITLETDLEIVAMIGKAAIDSGNVGYFSVRPGYEISNINETTGTVTFAENSKYAIQDKPSWFRNIGVPMQKVSNVIHAKTGKGGANFAIVSPTLATVIETIEGFTANTDGTQDWIDAGFTNIGSFRNRYRIYKNPYSVADNMMIMGYRGTGFLDFGAAYCPYIPLIMLPNIMQPTNLTPTKGVYTRYAKTMLRNDYYGAIFVQGLETI